MRTLVTSLSALLVSAAEGEGDGMHIPTLEEFFPPAILFEGTAFEINRIGLVRILAGLVLCLLIWLGARGKRLVPTRGQSVFELIIEFIHKNIAVEVLGPQAGRRYLPLLSTLFLAVFALNITGVIPFLNVSSNSLVAVPIILALTAWVAFIVAGIKQHGVVGYVRSALFPAGVPGPVYILLTPIELISTFILRPATLTMRLMANMISGHFLLAAFYGMTNYLLIEASGALKAVGALSFAAALAFTLFEIFIAALQAYIFALLTAVYISLSREAH